jgi:hypothetical protein
VVPVTSLRTSVANEDDRGGVGPGIGTYIFREGRVNKLSILVP